MPTEDKSWGKAAWVSGALLVVPLAGMVALFALTGDDDGDAPVASGSAPPPVAAPLPPPLTPEPPSPVARAAPAPPPVEGSEEPPEDELAGDELAGHETDEPEPAPSVLDPCCEALLEMSSRVGGAASIARRTCVNGRSFDDPNVAYKAVKRILERDGLEVPRACRP